MWSTKAKPPQRASPKGESNYDSTYQQCCIFSVTSHERSSTQTTSTQTNLYVAGKSSSHSCSDHTRHKPYNREAHQLCQPMAKYEATVITSEVSQLITKFVTRVGCNSCRIAPKPATLLSLARIPTKDRQWKTVTFMLHTDYVNRGISGNVG